MDLSLTPAEESFRDELRDWLAANHPGEQAPPGTDDFAWRRDWQRTMRGGGYLGLSWPAEFGGAGATLDQQAIFNIEAARAGVPRPASIVGLHIAGPAIIAHGSEEQKARLLPPILSAEEIWCQGFSEPDAGSDLASLRTRARPAEGGWQVTGQKIWTSGAHRSRWCILLARSDADAPLHKGITCFILDLDQAGVEVRPLRTATGDHEFNELFLEDAEIPAERVLGVPGGGWSVAMTALGHERLGLGSTLAVGLRRQLDAIVEQCREKELLGDAEIVDRCARLHAQIENLQLVGLRGVSAQLHGFEVGGDALLPKLLWAQASQDLAELAVDVGGLDPLDRDARASFAYLRSKATSIEGGTSDILRNVVAERVLGLPKVGRG